MVQAVPAACVPTAPQNTISPVPKKSAERSRLHFMPLGQPPSVKSVQSSEQTIGVVKHVVGAVQSAAAVHDSRQIAGPSEP